MASIHKHRDKYQVRVRRKGLPTITKTFHKLSDAKEWATLQERQADRGELGPDRKELERVILADLIDRYLKEVVPRKRHGETDTFALNMVRRHKVAKKRLSDLSPSDFTSYRDERLPEHDDAEDADDQPFDEGGDRMNGPTRRMPSLKVFTSSGRRLTRNSLVSSGRSSSRLAPLMASMPIAAVPSMS